MSLKTWFCHIYNCVFVLLSVNLFISIYGEPPLYRLFLKESDTQYCRKTAAGSMFDCVQGDISEHWPGFVRLDGLKMFGHYRRTIPCLDSGCDPAGKCKRRSYQEMFGHNHLGTQWQSQTFPVRHQIWMPGRDCCCCSRFSLGPGFLEDWLVMAH